MDICICKPNESGPYECDSILKLKFVYLLHCHKYFLKSPQNIPGSIVAGLFSYFFFTIVGLVSGARF